MIRYWDQIIVLFSVSRSENHIPTKLIIPDIINDTSFKFQPNKLYCPFSPLLIRVRLQPFYYVRLHSVTCIVKEPYHNLGKLS